MTDSNIFLSNALTRAAAGALAIAMTFVTVSAAKAETNNEYRANVEAGIAQKMRMPVTAKQGRHGVATLAVTISAEGAVQSVDVVKSSGIAAFDREAIRTAQQVTYPATANSRTIAMVLGFNEQVQPAHQRAGQKLVAAYIGDQKVMLANSTTAQQPDS